MDVSIAPARNWHRSACLSRPLPAGPSSAGRPAGRWATCQTPPRRCSGLPGALIFFLGYAVWVARLSAIVFDTIGRSVLRALFAMIVWKRRPDSDRDVLPSRERLLEMLVRAQKAGLSFAPVGWLVGLGAGLAATLFTSQVSASGRFLFVAATSVAWGHLLARLGRRGWLPFPEEE